MRTIQCLICGRDFTTGAHNIKYCPNCRGKGENCTRTARRRKHKIKSIPEIMRELEEYNRVHGTYLTYGKYVALLSAEEER